MGLQEFGISTTYKTRVASGTVPQWKNESMVHEDVFLKKMYPKAQTDSGLSALQHASVCPSPLLLHLRVKAQRTYCIPVEKIPLGASHHSPHNVRLPTLIERVDLLVFC